MPNTDWKQVCAACAEGTPPERCAYYGDPNGCNAPTLGAHPEGDLAERLQEALEKAERRIAELERATGNAAALREALVKIEKLNHYDLGCVRSEKSRRAMDAKILDIELTIRAALAAPARNCDRYTTAKDALDAFIREKKIKSADVDNMNLRDFFDWLFDMVEKGGAK